MKRKTCKFITAALVCASILTVAGCSKKDPFTVYDEASKKTSALESMESKVAMKMTMSAAGQSMDISVDTDVKMSGVNTDSMLMNMDATTNVLGQDIAMTAYYKDGYYYTDTNGSKIKYAMEIEELEKQVTSGALQAELKKEDFKEITMEKKDGNYVVTYTISGDSMSSIVDSALGSLSGMLDSADMTMDISDIKGTATVNKDGYFTEMDMKMPLAMSVQDQEMTLDMDMKASYIDPGKKVTVEIPENLDDYQEVDMNALAEQAAPAADDTTEDAEEAKDAEDETFSDTPVTDDTDDTAAKDAA